MANIKIYQLKRENLRYFGFLGFNESKKLNGREVTLDDYNLVYDANLPIVLNHDLGDYDEIFEMFNINRPEDFKGHSLSVSDIVRLDNGEFWYCDSFGWYLLNWEA